MIKFVNNGELLRDGVAPKAFSNMLDTFISEAIKNSGGVTAYRPGADILEHENMYEIKLALPGYTKEEISLELKENKLTVSNKKVETENPAEAEAGANPEKGIRYHIREIYAGDFSRTFRLPENADKDSICAEFKDGILSVQIQKADPKAGTTTIEIK